MSESPSSRERAAEALPRWAERLLERVVPERNRDIVLGDFAEVFQYIATSEGRGRALRWYAGQLLKSLPAFLFDGLHFGTMMLGNYLKTAFRSLRKRAFFSALNIGGLAIGMAACLLIIQYVVFETSYDAFHAHSDDTYRVIQTRSKNGEVRLTQAITYSAFGPALQEEVPELVAFTRVHPNYGTATLAVTDEQGRRTAYREQGLGYVDSTFFQIFSFPLIQGDPATALAEPGSIVLSRSAAQKLFEGNDPMGQTVEMRAWASGTFRVTGVMEDMPGNSHLQYEYLAPMADLLKSPQYEDTEGWSWTNFGLYLQLQPGAKAEQAAAKATDVLYARLQDRIEEWQEEIEVSLQPLEAIHLQSSDLDEDYAGVRNARTVYFFILIALFILVIAWVNYVNLTTARAMERAREVGVRKAAGAHRSQVVAQFLTEASVMNVLALGLAAGLAALGLPYLNELAEVEIGTSIWTNPWFWSSVVGIFGGGAVLVSLYPAFVLSAFRPAAVLKGTLGRASKDRLRQVLVVFQFAASIALLTGTYIVYEQVAFLRSQDTGLDIDEVLVVRRPSFVPEEQDYGALRDAFIEEVKRMPAVQEVASSWTVPGNGHNLGSTFRRESQAASEAQNVNMSWVTHTFLDTYGMDLVAGRGFSPEITSDAEEAVLLNETAVEALGYASPDEALGERIFVSQDNPFTIIGVLEDYHWMSLKQEVTPILLGLTEGGGGLYSLRLATNDLDATLAGLQRVYDNLFPGNPFDYFFADENFDRQYQTDRRFGTLFGLFAGLALVVACLGLVGLASYTVAQRTKEIGIRKVLGASMTGIARSVLFDFTRWIVLALVLAAPLVYLGAQQWLEGFAVRVNLGLWTFVAPGLLVLLVAVVTVSYHTLRIAHINPVTALRYE